MGRVITFRVPVASAKSSKQQVVSDRLLTWDVVKTLMPNDDDSIEPPSANAAMVLDAFHAPPDELLHVPKRGRVPTPFEYYSRVNAQENYTTEPRLSVTKLLTDAYCELQNFYEVYAGLPKTAPTARMMSGTAYHAALEEQTHPQIGLDLVREKIDALLLELPNAQAEALRATTQSYELAQSWFEQSMKRILSITKTRFSREIFLHGFLDLTAEKLVTNENDLKKAVLVNGIADFIRITKQPCVHDYSEKAPEAYSKDLELVLENLSISKRIVDLDEALPAAKRTMSELAKDHYLQLGDVKTRQRNDIPFQKLVIHSAKVQCMYYAQFLCNLSQSAEFAYESCLENGKRRQVDPDEPVSIAYTAEIIVANFEHIVLDCLRLARGETIRFASSDKHTPTHDFSLSQLVNEEQFREMLQLAHGSAFSEIDILALFQPWKKPLTLRYFAARSGQAFNLFEAFKPASLCVEYHNVRTKEIIERMHYKFSGGVLHESVRKTSLFWDGRRIPRETKDRSRCKHCDYKGRCPAVNVTGEKLGSLAHQLLED